MAAAYNFSMLPVWKPTAEQIRLAHGKTLHDTIAPNLKVLFCGINPGLYTAAVGHHFARPGNRFWPALHMGGFTPRIYSPFEEKLLLELGLGVTNIVNYATCRADELEDAQLHAGAKILVAQNPAIQAGIRRSGGAGRLSRRVSEAQGNTGIAGPNNWIDKGLGAAQSFRTERTFHTQKIWRSFR